MSHLAHRCGGSRDALPDPYSPYPRDLQPSGSYSELLVKAEKFPRTTEAPDDRKQTTGTHRLSVVILTYNEQANLPACLESLGGLDCEILVVDSGSTDETLDIARNAGAAVFTHPFENYAAQRNWAQKNLCLDNDWVLHLDADERLTPALVEEITRVLEAPPDGINGSLLRTRT